MFLSRHEMWATTSMPAPPVRSWPPPRGASLAWPAPRRRCLWRGLHAPSTGAPPRRPAGWRYARGRSTSTVTAKPVRSRSANSEAGSAGCLRPSGLLHDAHRAACPFASDPEVPQRPESASRGPGWPAAAAYEPRPGFGELHSVLGEVVDIPLKSDVATDELGEAGVGEGRDGTRPVGHLFDDLHHPLRADGTVGPRQVGAPGGDLTRSPLWQPFGQRLAVLDEGLVRQDRRA